jgi:hypothetical protein
MGARSAAHAAQPTPRSFGARANCSALRSVPTTKSKHRAMSAVAWPEPAPQSHAIRRRRASDAKYSMSAAGYRGRNAE